ncbi:hypothetical protein DM02DRAFT_675887 [Periconia macrospinosa]|uniref:BTB domain-containing protein n=1 Tax=Periconia macrospinosa TaxID=97972 RepID=A0A2V1DA15_9PLEO|nr:hypothetical protein DM02DRAFT_675887 [Periconia macrospinosa]
MPGISVSQNENSLPLHLTVVGASHYVAFNDQDTTEVVNQPEDPTQPTQPTDFWQICSLQLLNEILQDSTNVRIYYANGTKKITIDRTLICTHSDFFRSAFNGSFMEAQTGTIRIRGDFPLAVEAMIMFLKEGYYSFDMTARRTYPRLTMLDMHIHAYLIAMKYCIPALVRHSIPEYMRMGTNILRCYVQAYPTAWSDTWSNSRPLENRPFDDSPAGEVEQLLDSISLLWKNTDRPNDPMRFAVMKTLEPFFNRLARLKMFASLCMYLDGFAEDLRLFFKYQGLDFNIIETPMRDMNQLRFYSMKGCEVVDL